MFKTLAATEISPPGRLLSIGDADADISASIGGRLGVAIGAEQAEIRQSVVIAFPIDMVKLQGDWPSVPAVTSARLTPPFLEPGQDQPLLQVIRQSGSAFDQQYLEGSGRNIWPVTVLAPRFPDEVAGVDAASLNPALESAVVAAAP